MAVSIKKTLYISDAANRVISNYQIKHGLSSWTAACNEIVCRSEKDEASENETPPELFVDLIKTNTKMVEKLISAIESDGAEESRICPPRPSPRLAQDEEDNFGYEGKSVMYLLRKIAHNTDACAEMARDMHECRELIAKTYEQVALRYRR